MINITRYSCCSFQIKVKNLRDQGTGNFCAVFVCGKFHAPPNSPVCKDGGLFYLTTSLRCGNI